MISLRLTELIFNGLVGINEKQEIVPELAEKWEMPDRNTYIFHLRKDDLAPARRRATEAVHGRRRGLHVQYHDAPQDHNAAQGALRIHLQG
jgi:ABC-type oligopeptide transport system substrate-binding subunit